MLSSTGTIPYRRLTDPLILPVAVTSTRTAVPASFIPQEATSFRVTNPNAFWVRLRGATGPAAATLSIGATEGWLFPPGFSGIFTTQFPEAMATIAVGLGAGNGTLEISYGVGGGGESAFYAGGTGGGSGNVNATQAGSWTVAVNNFPATQTISGSVSVSNLPSSQAVTVGNFPATQPVSGSVSVSNFPATQPVSGTVAATQSGTWNISNFPSVQTVTSRGTGSMVTGQVAMAAQNTAYLVAAARATRRSITFVPTSQFTYFYGNSGVTTTTGAAAVNGSAITLETTAAVYVVSSSTGTMTFVEHF